MAYSVCKIEQVPILMEQVTILALQGYICLSINISTLSHGKLYLELLMSLFIIVHHHCPL